MKVQEFDAVHFRLKRLCRLRPFALQRFSFLAIVFLQFLLHLDVETDLQLVVDQIFGLAEIPDELFSLFFPQASNFGPLHDSCCFELFFFALKLCLSVTKLLSQNFLLKVQIYEDLQIFLLFISLLFFDDPFDLTVLGNLVFQNGLLPHSL